MPMLYQGANPFEDSSPAMKMYIYKRTNDEGSEIFWEWHKSAGTFHNGQMNGFKQIMSF